MFPVYDAGAMKSALVQYGPIPVALKVVDSLFSYG